MQAEQIFYLKSQNEKTQSDLEDLQVTRTTWENQNKKKGRFYIFCYFFGIKEKNWRKSASNIERVAT